MPPDETRQLWVEEPGLLDPMPHGEERRWFEAAARGELIVSGCSECGRLTFPLRVVCAQCGHHPLDDRAVAGTGSIHSFTVQQRRQHPDVPIPNVIALIDLDEGPRLMSRVVTDAPDDVAVGMRVQARFVERGEIGIPVFVPDEGALDD